MLWCPYGLIFIGFDTKDSNRQIDYIIIWGLVSASIVATYIISKFPHIANKIAPIITNLFSPLVLITLVIFLISIITTGKDPYNDREISVSI